MNQTDLLILLAKESATLKLKVEILDTIDKQLEDIRRQIKELKDEKDS